MPRRQGVNQYTSCTSEPVDERNDARRSTPCNLVVRHDSAPSPSAWPSVALTEANEQCKISSFEERIHETVNHRGSGLSCRIQGRSKMGI